MKDRFAKIRNSRGLPLSWPGDHDFRTLVAISVPLFISAANLCRFIENLKWQPTVRPTEILVGQANYATKIERTFLPILTRLLEDQDGEYSEMLLKGFQLIVGATIRLAIPLSVDALSQLFNFQAEIIVNRLAAFSSVLSIPNNRDIPVKIFHSSFRDFLLKSKSKFGVNREQPNKDILLRCLAVMRDKMKKNICNLASNRAERSEIDHQSLQQHFPPELQYSCRYWVYHLSKSKYPLTEMGYVFLLLKEHFLH